jgi:hypothetical protein
MHLLFSIGEGFCKPRLCSVRYVRSKEQPRSRRAHEGAPGIGGVCIPRHALFTMFLALSRFVDFVLCSPE